MNKLEFKKAYREARMNHIGEITAEYRQYVLECKHKKGVRDRIGNNYRNLYAVKTIETMNCNLLRGMFLR